MAILPPNVSDETDDVKNKLKADFSGCLDRLFEQAQSNGTPRKIEKNVWKELVALGSLILSCLLSLICKRTTQKDLIRRGLTEKDIQLRTDQSYWNTIKTTFGSVQFFLFSYRFSDRKGQNITRTPAREIFPYHSHCRSSELCLEWESRLGSDHPFRYAQKALTFFTHAAVHLEDNTIEKHMVTVSKLVSRNFLYRTPEAIYETLKNKASRDKNTDRPIVYISSDAHALRRYVDETWDARWKMVNGIRIWCEDQKTGRIIHLGGEYMWGNYEKVREAFEWLIEHGILPKDGHYGEGVHAQLTWLSDGMPWFEDHIHPLFTDLTVILDGYHVLERLSKYANDCFGKGTKEARRWYAQAASLIHGKEKPSKIQKAKRRKGHKKNPSKTKKHAHQNRPSTPVVPYQTVLDLGQLIMTTEPKNEKIAKNRHKLMAYINHNLYRMDYASYRQQGYQIGSGAMESMHRTGSQKRTKIAGARWLAESSQAVFNLRMIQLVERWDEFWAQGDFSQQLHRAFISSNASKKEKKKAA